MFFLIWKSGRYGTPPRQHQGGSYEEIPRENRHGGNHTLLRFRHAGRTIGAGKAASARTGKLQPRRGIQRPTYRQGGEDTGEAERAQPPVRGLNVAFEAPR